MTRPVGVKMVLCSYLRILNFSPSRLCRHRSIHSLCWAIFARCQLGVLDRSRRKSRIRQGSL